MNIDVSEGADVVLTGDDGALLHQPTAEGFVWRLPSSLATSCDNPELRVEMQTVGESNRMALMFRKPNLAYL